MTSIIKFQPISGAMDESPPCYLLEIDDVHILLDCGWDEKFDMNIIKDLKRVVNNIDAVLLSHADAYHLGALPYLVGKLGLNCPIYSTIPVQKMGQMFMYDLYMSHFNMGDFDTFSLDDVDLAFDKIIQLKYNQTVALKGKAYGISIIPLSSGHMIGGTIWKISKAGEEEDIIYAIDFNHKKERHLGGCELERMQRPSLLITDAFNIQYQQARRRARDEKLVTNILQTVRNNGNVLIATDTAGRVLELAYMLEQLWKNKDSGLMAYSLVMLNNVTYNVIEFAKSQIEWMNEKLMKNFEGARNNPFQFKYVQLCHNLEELERLASPKVVLASSPDLESGYSRDLFLEWVENPINSIILTSRTGQGTLAMNVFEHSNPGEKIELEIRRRVELQGNELEEYLRTQGEKPNPLIVRQELHESESSDSEEDIEMSIITGKHDILVRGFGRQSSGFFKSNKRHVMFPFYEEKIRSDEYGEIVNLDEFRAADATNEDNHNEDSKENTSIKKEETILDERKKNEITDSALLERPTKLTIQQRTIEINAQIQRIDFEGRADGESLRKILTSMRPRRILIVHGPEENTQIFANCCEQSFGARPFAPSKGEIIDVTSELNIYQVRLTESLVAQLHFQKGKDAEVAWLDGRIGLRNNALDLDKTESAMLDDSLTLQSKKTLILDKLNELEIPVHKGVLINELKLNDFRQVLIRNNISSEFSGAVLLCCNGTIALRRTDVGKVVLEGAPTPEYYQVRELLYAQYAML